jgi:hypothetical protein
MGRDAGLLIQQLILPPGTAGGHGPVAGGQVPLMDAPLEQVTLEIETRFLNVMDEVGPGEPLLNQG